MQFFWRSVYLGANEKDKAQCLETVNKKTKLKVADQVVKLKSERSLFARLIVVAKSRPEIDIKDCIGKFEFTTFPRSLFDGSGKSYDHDKQKPITVYH